MPSTLVISPAKGTGRLGSDLDSCYQGELVQGQRHGYGSYTYPNAFFKYEGEYVHGKKHGYGRLTLGDGGVYEGEFQNDEIQGEGMRTFANGNKYTGTFEQGEMHGFGLLELAAGDRYEGHMSHNLYHGNGCYRYVNGDVYQGEFAAHKLHGQGVFQAASGTRPGYVPRRYQGDWVQGLRCGRGECVFSNGDVYRGQWASDQMEGEGEYLTKRLGVQYKGAFAAGKPVQAAEKLNASFDVEVAAESGRGKGGGKGKGAAVDLEAMAGIEVAPGQELPNTITLAAQQAIQKRALGSVDGTVATADAATSSRTQRMHQEQPPAGCLWQDVDCEHGRLISMTLHAQVKKATTTDKVLVRLAVVEDGGNATTASDPGTTPDVRVRVLVSYKVEASPCLPLAVTASGQRITCVEFKLEAGRHTLPPLSVGCLLPSGAWSAAPGAAYTFLFTSPEVSPAQLVAKVLPDAAKKK